MRACPGPRPGLGKGAQVGTGESPPKPAWGGSFDLYFLRAEGPVPRVCPSPRQMPKVRPRHVRVWSPGGNANPACKPPLHLASPPPQTPQRPAPFPTQTIEGRHLGPYQPCARDTSEGVSFGRAEGNKKSIFLVPSENVYCQGGDPSEDSFAFGFPPPSSFVGTVFTLVQYTVFLPGSARSAKKSAGESASEHRGVLGRVQVKGVGVGVADQVEVMPV